jgi:hypothetical protein
VGGDVLDLGQVAQQNLDHRRGRRVDVLFACPQQLLVEQVQLCGRHRAHRKGAVDRPPGGVDLLLEGEGNRVRRAS